MGKHFLDSLVKKNCVLDFSHVRNSIHNTLSGVSMYCLIHHQGSRCINEYIVRGGVVLENVSSPLRFITKYIHFCLFNKVNVIANNHKIAVIFEVFYQNVIINFNLPSKYFQKEYWDCFLSIVLGTIIISWKKFSHTYAIDL